jgi:aryl-alcohol dehydrogenase-like predicted oxidoreductase
VSKIVLGGYSFHNLSEYEVHNLLNTAQKLGITRVDTAPSYGVSEKHIGSFLNCNSNFRVSTKVGQPNPEKFGPESIKTQVYSSLEKMNVQSFETLFVHNVPQAFITDESIQTLIELKTQGIFQRLGYSGDGDDLRFAIDTQVFDSFMSTLNILDQSNLHSLKSIKDSKFVYVKRALARGVWDVSIRNKAHIALDLLIGKKKSTDQQSYNFRFYEIFERHSFFTNYLELFFNFANSHSFVDYLALGTSSAKHLKELANIESKGILMTNEEIDYFYNIWRERNLYSWVAKI